MKKHRTVVPDFSRKAPRAKPSPGATGVSPPPPDRTSPAVPKPHSTSQKSGRRGG